MTDFYPCHCYSFQSPVVSLSNNEVSSDKVYSSDTEVSYDEVRSSIDDHDSSDKEVVNHLSLLVKTSVLG